MTMLSTAKEVLLNESNALQKMAHELDGMLGVEFEKTVQAILALKGRVVLTGMGKSGHIAKKIAATLASTGTPSFYIHPAEASHGDMGMLTKNDMLIALSKSGKTSELVDLIEFSGRYSLPLVAMTENDTSPLAKHANYFLKLPNIEEACPLGSAPTTSTTLMLALGDALALTLLSERGFTAEDFNIYHPGGSLGKKLMRVQDIMHTGKEVPLVPEDMPMSEGLVQMTKYSFGCLGVLSKDDTLVGVITDGDLRRNMDSNLLNKQVSSIMRSSPVTVTPETMVSVALQIMNSKKITSVFVIENNNVAGILHIHDCLRAGIQ